MKLTYFDFDGGRAEAARIAFSAGHIKFEDHRINFATFAKSVQTYPYKAVPVLEIEGEIITQSVAITQYAGKLSGYYPKDSLEQLKCDEILNVIENATQIFGPSVKAKDPQKIKLLREELVAGYLSTFISGLGKTLEHRGDKFFSDQRITIADFAVFSWINWVQSGMLDHIPKTLISELAPNLIDYHARLSTQKEIKGYYDMRKKTKEN